MVYDRAARLSVTVRLRSSFVGQKIDRVIQLSPRLILIDLSYFASTEPNFVNRVRVVLALKSTLYSVGDQSCEKC